jgi:acetyltransferase-like isoleucine patch superfamily enzyme
MLFGITETARWLGWLRRPIDRLLFNRMGRRGRLVAGGVRSLRGRARVRGRDTIAAGEENRVEFGRDAAFNGRIEFRGKQNMLELAAGSRFDGTAKLRGSGNLLRIADETSFSGSVVIGGQGNRLLIGARCDYNGKIFIKGFGQTVVFGDDSAAADVTILCAEGTDIRIGKWCLLSRSIEIRSTDAHSLIDRETRMRTNPAASVEIGDHVWIGVGVIIAKGAAVPADSVVGARSFVNGRFDEEGVVLAGAPASIVKRGITWHRARKPRFSAAEMNHWKS